MIELARPKTHAVMPDPQVNARFLLMSILCLLKISINLFFSLKVLSDLLINSIKGRFLDPSMFPLLSSFLNSGCSP